MTNMYRIGRRAERKLAGELRGRNYRNVRLSKGSRGPADVYGVKNGVKTYLQVKANTARETRGERVALRRLAQKRGGRAAIVYKRKSGTRWKFLGDFSR